MRDSLPDGPQVPLLKGSRIRRPFPLGQPLRIVLGYPVEERHVRQIAACADHLEVIDAGQQRIATELLEADIFCGHAKVPVDWESVVGRGRLRWIQSSAAGLDHCLVPSVIDSEIVVSSASGLFANQVAEQTLALVAAWTRRLPVFFRAQQSKVFERLPTGDLRGQTVGIVGFGGNGRRIAELLAPWQVRLLATDVFPVNKPDYVEAIWPADDLPRLLADSNVLILCVPLNDATRGMISADQFTQMNRDALLVNVARGPIVCEADLIAVLSSGQLAGAALDVVETEPLASESPLWDMPNVIITPHVGAQSASRYADMTDFFCRNLKRFIAGEELWNRVDKHLGFPTPDVRWSPFSG